MQRAVNVCMHLCLSVWLYVCMYVCMAVCMHHLLAVCVYLLADCDDQDEYWTQVLRDYKYGAFPISTIAPSVTAGVEVCACEKE